MRGLDLEVDIEASRRIHVEMLGERGVKVRRERRLKKKKSMKSGNQCFFWLTHTHNMYTRKNGLSSQIGEWNLSIGFKVLR